MPQQPLTAIVHRLHNALGADAPDAELLARFRRHRDPAAFEAMVRRHGPRVVAGSRRVLADPADVDDAVQATFLVLMRKPGSVRDGRRLGPWLAGVAHRVALKAAARRKRREQVEARAESRPPATADLSWREACAILHEELDRLPDRYRLPLILCYLDGLSRDEAAMHLGRSLNGVKKALEGGRERLRKRLVRRGVTLSAGLLGAVGGPVSGEPVTEVAVLACSPVRPAVAELAARVRVGFPVRAKVLGMVLAASVLAVGVAFGLPDERKEQPGKDKEMPGKATAKAETPADTGPKEERLSYSGRVIDPHEKPVKGAKIFLANKGEVQDQPAMLALLATTEEDGRFKFTVPRPRSGRFYRPHLTVRADGFGLGLRVVGEQGMADAEVRLFTDEPVRGRIVDLQGKPVAGATIRAVQIAGQETDDLSAWLREAQGPGLTLVLENVFEKLPQNLSLRRRSLPGLDPAMTDKDGRFTLSGIGRDRLAALSVTGPGIAASEIFVVTREGKPGQFKLTAGGQSSRQPFFRVPFDHVVSPEQPLEGRVTDRDSGEPIAGVAIEAWGHGFGTLKVVTDKDGRFRFAGLPPGGQFFDVNPSPDTPYHRRTVSGGKRDNILPTRMDVRLRRAPWVAGTVIDEKTRRPIAGATVVYKAARGNPSAADYFDKLRSVDVRAKTAPDGTFRLTGIPGKGWLFVTRDTPGVSAAERPVQGDADGLDPPTEIMTSDQAGRGPSPRTYQALVAVNVDPKRPKEYAITLDAGVTVPTTLTDPDGKPLVGAITLGVSGHYFKWSDPLPGANLEVPAFNPNRPRAFVLYHPDRNLGIVVRPAKGDAGPWTIKLLPTATVTGRLLLPDGKPYPNADLSLSFEYPGAPPPSWPPDKLAERRTRTDAEGRFRFTKIIGDVDYELWYSVLGDKFNASTTIPFRAKPGETKDLGDLKTAEPRK